MDNAKINFSHGDFVSIKEVVGMTELNETPPRPVRIISPTSFSIEDTSKFSEYSNGGVVEYVKIPKPVFHRSLRENFDKIEPEDFGLNM